MSATEHMECLTVWPAMDDYHSVSEIRGTAYWYCVQWGPSQAVPVNEIYRSFTSKYPTYNLHFLTSCRVYTRAQTRRMRPTRRVPPWLQGSSGPLDCVLIGKNRTCSNAYPWTASKGQSWHPNLIQAFGRAVSNLKCGRATHVYVLLASLPSAREQHQRAPSKMRLQ